jgi:hypothetical protein
MNGPDKLECYITLGWKGLPGMNTLGCRAHLQVMKKMKSCEYGLGVIFTTFHFLGN